MPDSATALAKAIAATAVALIAAVPTVYYGLRALDASTSIATAHSSSPLLPPEPPAPPYTGPRSQNDAMALLADLPEVKAWSEHLQRTSGGTVAGTLVRYSPIPREIGGKHYWQFSYIANGPDMARRWETFLVGQDNPDVLVDDIDAGSRLTLSEWRRNKEPMKRIVAQAAPAPAFTPVAN
jgi:hypothetical protein